MHIWGEGNHKALRLYSAWLLCGAGKRPRCSSRGREKGRRLGQGGDRAGHIGPVGHGEDPILLRVRSLPCKFLSTQGTQVPTGLCWKNSPQGDTGAGGAGRE
jgi:hypothetical protein